MGRRIFGSNLVIASLLGVCGVCGAAAILAACSSSSSGNNPGNDASTGGKGGSEGGGGGGGGDSAVGACTPSGKLQIHFAPMYTAFVTDSTMQKFQVPAVVTGGTGTATWSASDTSAVSFAADPSTGGTMMTVKSAATPSVTITAQVGSDCATTTLNITSAVEADWAAGNARYNNGVPLITGCIDQRTIPVLAEAGIPVNLPGPPDSGCPDAGPACTSCHGANPTSPFFAGVEHSPEQTAGFADQDLINIFVNGVVVDGGAYDPNVLPYNFWQSFHTWSDISTPEAQKGMVVYLRSLTPVLEEGGLNFGGLADAGVTLHD